MGEGVASSRGGSSLANASAESVSRLPHAQTAVILSRFQAFPSGSRNPRSGPRRTTSIYTWDIPEFTPRFSVTRFSWG
ncbi:hypothetical protein PUNSTDRAFT_50797 [Punctularia strigosozonata HHB-11173 SS5]|uniref:uncharacterized protein n=1 Tax=Punctularia strigosozonata (strain HHB-11173) TaxID=741275 RepID=UPI0004418333|nr:uncharacterized protein PUNSTDRAFT_50797 [Punctularia strigosozonata HHB-11173 SS5]EIN12038.1 hypothetical protein PUNSTDRAFT_50797 [Punctularia strigosozonata HHB-11173 SS5]